MENKIELPEKFKKNHPKLANFIENKAPKVLNVIGGVLPDKGVLGIVKNIISSDPDISPEDKLEFEKLYLEYEREETKRYEIEQKAVTDRWAADMNSDSWLSKNTRPLVILSLLAFLYIVIITDSCNIPFEVKSGYVTLLETLLVTVTVAYFGGRTLEKGTKMFTGKKK